METSPIHDDGNLTIHAPQQLGPDVWLVRLRIRKVDVDSVKEVIKWPSLVPSGARRLLLADLRGTRPGMDNDVRKLVKREMDQAQTPSYAVAIVAESLLGRLAATGVALATRRTLMRAFATPEEAEAWLRRRADHLLAPPLDGSPTRA